MNGTNTFRVLQELITRLKAKITSTSIKAELDKHPEYYSFLGMSDVLRTFRIPNGVFELSYKQLDELEVPFIAHLSSNSGEFVLVTGINSEGVILCNEVYANKECERTWFNNSYTGRVLVAETEGTVEEPDFLIKKRRELRSKYRRPLVTTGALIVIICLLGAKSPLLQTERSLFCSLILKLTGAITSILLILKSINISNPLLNRLCFTGPRSDCNQVIYSHYSKITDGLSWAEAGLFYFCSTFLILLVGSAWPGVVGCIAVLAMLSSLYIFYSLYLQAFVIKQWCILCLLTLAILGLDAVCLFSYFEGHPILPPITVIFTLIACLLAPAVFWPAIKIGIKASNELATAREQLRDIKGRNIHLFNGLMATQPVSDLLPAEVTIIEGEASARTLITIVSKPYCDACGDAHREISSWLKVRDDIQVQLVFYVLNYDGDEETAAATYIMQAYRELGSEKAKEVLNEWFAGKTKDLKLLAQRYPLINPIDVSADLKLQQQWCLENDVDATPMILINGRPFPAFYKPEEIRYFV